MAHKSAKYVWTAGRLTILNRMMAAGWTMEEMGERLSATHAQIEYRVAQIRQEAQPNPVAGERTAGALIHRNWMDEDYLRNLIEMHERG